jgi:predicted regulator of Ras-like GTPase activity (Roadblock/LC7/MglB family)
MPKPKTKLEKISQEDIEINMEEVKPPQPHISSLKARIKEPLTNTIRTVLDEIKAKEGVVGYILRNSKSASIDLNDPTKIIDYAVLSSSAINMGEELSQTFDLGEIKNVLVEGKEIKLLSVAIGENNVSIFMEKNVDHNHVYKILSHIA